MKNHKQIEKTLKIPLYVGRLTIIIDEDLPSIVKKYPALKKDYLEKHGAVTFWKGTNVYTALELKHITPGLIAHEAKHVVNRIFINIGHYLDLDNDEPECYLLSWVVNRIVDAHNELLKKSEVNPK